MMPIRILHTADIHLGASLGNFGDLARERQRDFERTFDRIINLAIKRDVDCLVVAGDLFESNSVAGDLVGRVQEGFARLAGRGIAVVLIPGTHDHAVAGTSIYRRYPFPGVHLLLDPAVSEPLRLAVRGTDAYFYGFAYSSVSSGNPLASMARRQPDGIHIGLLHGSLKGSPEWEMRLKDLPFSPADLAALRLDYVALGHYHSHAVVEYEGRPIACYPGSPEGKKFGENGPRYAVLAEVEPGKVVMEKLAVQSRMLLESEVDCSLYSSPDALPDALARLAAPDIIARIRLSGVVEEPLGLANLSGRVQGRFAWLELVDGTDLFDSGYVKRLAREDSIRGMFVRKIEARIARAADPAERAQCREALKLVFKRFAWRQG